MSNFKQIHGDNILPFRLRGQKPRSQPRKHDLKQPLASRRTKPTSQAGPTAEQNNEYVRLLTSKGNPTVELVDECAPAIVRRIVKHVRKNSRPNNHVPKTLPRALSRELRLLCNFDHPAGTVLRDWLNGKLHALPDGFEEACARSTKMKEISRD